MPHDSLWRVALAVTVLVFFGLLGIAHVLNPDWFIKRSGLRKGGELLTECADCWHDFDNFCDLGVVGHVPALAPDVLVSSFCTK